MNLAEQILAQYRMRPLWMQPLFLFCLYMTFIYLPWDIFIKPLAEDQEVWFGILFTGWLAKFGGLLHWYIYGAGSYGFFYMKRWMMPWAPFYILQIAFGMFVWSVLDERSGGLLVAAIVAAVFVGIGYLLWRARHLFSG